jgi:hypothetical protein
LSLKLFGTTEPITLFEDVQTLQGW